MSYLTYKQNDIVYIHEIGYATLIDCGKFKALSVKTPEVFNQKQSIYFDPDLFNSDKDSHKSKKQSEEDKAKAETTQQSVKEEKIQKQPEIENKDQESETKIVEKPINIIKLKLYGTNTQIYVQDSLIRKQVTIPVKALLGKHQSVFNIKIDINRNIETLKKQIFDYLNLKILYYYNIKMYITSPWLCELNTPSKLIYEHRIGQNTNLIITGKHAFCFEDIQENLQEYFLLANNSMTLVGKERPLPVPKLPEGLPPSPPQPPSEAPQKPEQNSVKQQKQSEQKKAEQKEEPKQSQTEEVKKDTLPKKEEQLPKSNETKAEYKQKEQIKLDKELPSFYYFYGDQSYETGRHYWEIKLDKLPKKAEQFCFGVHSLNKIYAYFPLLHQIKIFMIPEVSNTEWAMKNMIQDAESNSIDQLKGSPLKEGESSGLLIHFTKDGKSELSLYRNNIKLGKFFSGLPGTVRPIFGIGESGQISLDTRIQFPLDSYRRR